VRAGPTRQGGGAAASEETIRPPRVHSAHRGGTHHGDCWTRCASTASSAQQPCTAGNRRAHAAVLEPKESSGCVASQIAPKLHAERSATAVLRRNLSSGNFDSHSLGLPGVPGTTKYGAKPTTSTRKCFVIVIPHFIRPGRRAKKLWHHHKGKKKEKKRKERKKGGESLQIKNARYKQRQSAGWQTNASCPWAAAAGLGGATWWRGSRRSGSPRPWP